MADIKTRADFPRRTDIIKSRLRLVAAITYAARIHPAFASIARAVKQNHNRDYLGFSLDDPIKVSYAPRGAHRWDYKRRQRTKLGRYLRRQMKYEGPDADLDDFCHTVLSQINTDLRFRQVWGEAIRTAYKDEVGGHSCMTDEHADERLDVYVYNQDRVSLLIYEDERMQARAFVWKTNEGATCVDRIYPNDGYHVPLFESYAEAQGWILRSHNGLPGGKTTFGPDRKTYSVTVSAAEVWPYLDSFNSTDDDPEEEPEIVLATDGLGNFVFQETDGGFAGGPTCDRCGDPMRSSESHSVGEHYVCTSCYEDYYETCEGCDETHAREYMVICGGQFYCEDCAADTIIFCERCSLAVFTDDAVELAEGGYWCDGCANRRATYCEACDTYYRDTPDCDCYYEEEAEEEGVQNVASA